MKKTLLIIGAIVTLAASAMGQSTNKTITLAWDHDGQNTDGYLVSSRQSTNQPFVPHISVGPTNRIATLTLTNPPGFIQFTVQATNKYLPSDMSNFVALNQPAVPGTLRVVAVVTVQVP